MQCVNCQFENMPGLTKCVRCGSSLTLATANIDVLPPRAGRVVKQLRRVGFRTRFWSAPLHAIRRGIESVRNALKTISFEVPIYTALIPGWPQWVLKQRRLALVHFAAFMAFQIPSLLFLGSTVGSMCLAIVFSSHFSSVFSVLLVSRSDVRSRAVSGVSMLAVAALFVWFPMYRALEGFGWPMELLQPMAGFLRGDVILLEQGVARPGEMVVYQPSSQLPNLVFRGNWVGRVLAEGPAHVEWKSSKLTIDGLPSSWQPPAGGVPTQDQTMIVPAGCVLVLQPSEGEVVARNRRGVFYGPAVQILQLQQRITVVDQNRIVGRVRWQTWPLARWGTVD